MVEVVDQKYAVGTKFQKKFDGELYWGEIVSFESGEGFYHVVYEDGDEEDLENHDLDKLLLQDTPKPAKKKKPQQKKAPSAKTSTRTNVSRTPRPKTEVAATQGPTEELSEPAGNMKASQEENGPGGGSFASLPGDMAAQQDSVAPSPSQGNQQKYEIGTKFQKEFDGELYWGEIVSYEADERIYHAVYEDGDEEDLENHDLDQLLPSSKKKKTPQQRQKKTPGSAQSKTQSPLKKKKQNLFIASVPPHARPEFTQVYEHDDAITWGLGPRNITEDTQAYQQADATAWGLGLGSNSELPQRDMQQEFQPQTQTGTAQKYKIGTKFKKKFEGEYFLGEIVTFDAEEGMYHVIYEDGDEEDLENHELDQLLSPKKAKKKRRQQDGTPGEGQPEDKTEATRSGRKIAKISYNLEHLLEEEFTENSSSDDDDGDDDDDDDGDDSAAPPAKKQRASISNKPAGQRSKSNKAGSDSDASLPDDDSPLSDMEMDEEGDFKPVPNKREAGTESASKVTSNSIGSGKMTMVESFQPQNAPVYSRLSMEEILATKQYLDPGGMEATDDIIDHLVGDQVVKLGSLLQRAMKNDKSLGSARLPLKLGTACSGTDAPALALTIVQEQMEQRLGIKNNDDGCAPNGNTNGGGPEMLQFEHTFSCENDPFKQAYIARNFDSDLYPDIGKLCDKQPRDVYGRDKPLGEITMFIAGTSCKNFSMLRSKFRLDIEDRGCSGETFLAAVEVVFKKQPPFVIFENVRGAPWAKMSEYLTGRVKLSECNSSKSIKREGKGRNKDLIFTPGSDGISIEVEEVPDVYGVRCGAKVAGYLSGTDGAVKPVTWPQNCKKGQCTLDDLIKANAINRQNDTLVFETPCTYCTHWIDVDTKQFGLPQTRQRTYMFVWQAEHQEKGCFKPDDLGIFMESIVRHLEAPVKHSLEAFLLQVDHDTIRVFREALAGPPGRETKRGCFQEADFWKSTANANLAHNKVVRERIGMKDMARPITNWGEFGKKQVPLHYWLDYLNCNRARVIDLIDILHGSAARDAECHDSNFASCFWNVSQNVTKEKHRNATVGIAGCITPGGDFLLPNQGRPLLGCEKLLIQGIPYFRLTLGNETEVQLGDLAGNAMSLTVVCATILAAICAPQLRDDMRSSLGDFTASATKKRTAKNADGVVDQSAILDFLKQRAPLGKDFSISNHHSKWTGNIANDSAGLSAREDDDDSLIDFLHKLTKLADLAEKSSVWCTCETSGSNSRTNKFLRCQVCKASCCRNCVHAHAGYNVESHDTEDVVIGDGTTAHSANDVRHTGAFQAKLRNILPSSLYFTKEGIDSIASVAQDRYRIRGLENYTFSLHRIKRDRGKWLIIYYARENNGIGEALAELRVSVGSMDRGQKQKGVVGELTSFMPARTEPLQYGKLTPCCKISIPEEANPGSCIWQVKMPEGQESMQLSGQGITPSFRLEVGLTDDAAASLDNYVKGKSIRKAFGAAVERGEERRWVYPPNWKDWPESIRIRCFELGHLDSRIPGTYIRAKCQQTTNQSALWIKQAKSNWESVNFCPIYILIKPNVNRTGPDNAIITTSLDYHDSSSILAELDPKWQPCDALTPAYQKQNTTCYTWKNDSSIRCLVPASTIRVTSPKNCRDNLVLVHGLKKTEIAMLARGASHKNADSRLKLNVYHGQKAQQIIRVINTTLVAPILKFASLGGLKYDLSPEAKWETLQASLGEPFGSCQKVIPPRPKEQWLFDTERGSWERTSEPGASREYYRALHKAPKPFEFWLDEENRSLEVKASPHVVAHHAASNLLEGRKLEKVAPDGGLKVAIRLSDIGQQSDPEIGRFKVGSCASLPPTLVELRQPHQLYERQQKVVTKMLAIERRETQFTELEMSEFEMPGSFGFSLIAKVQRDTKICGGVIADAIGAGKTVISIGIILQGIEQARASRAAPRSSGASFVVVPPALIDQWASEVDKFSSSLSVVQIYDFKVLEGMDLGTLIDADVIICPIDILQSVGYLENLVQKSGLTEELGQELPQLPQYSGQQEQNAARGVWIPNESTDPYAGGNNPLSQKRRNQSARYTYVYEKAIATIRQKTFRRSDKGIPLEYLEFERVFVDEIHESLCTTKWELDSARERDKETGVGFFKEKNRRAGRELLGISQRDISRRPLVARRSIFGLTGTPLLDSSSRVIELANLMGGMYVIGLSSHWRKLERESGRDIFLHNYLEPKQSREIRKNIHEKCQDYLDVACCRNKSGKEMEGITQVNHCEVVRMTKDEKVLYTKSQKGIPSHKQSLAMTVEDFDPSAGHDVSVFLRQNAKLASRGAKLVDICNGILREEPRTKIVVFTDGRIGAGEAARDYLCADHGPGCTWLDASDSVQEKNKKIGWYQMGDATEEDKKRPRVLVLHFEHAAGLNLQAECHHLVLFTPLYIGDGGTTGDPVSDASTELQAIGRVFRAGQTNPQVHVYRIEVRGPNDEECLDGQLLRRNTDEQTVQMATNTGDD